MQAGLEHIIVVIFAIGACLTVTLVVMKETVRHARELVREFRKLLHTLGLW